MSPFYTGMMIGSFIGVFLGIWILAFLPVMREGWKRIEEKIIAWALGI